MSNMDVLLQTEASEMGGFEMLDGPPETEVEPKRPWIRPELMQTFPQKLIAVQYHAVSCISIWTV